MHVSKKHNNLLDRKVMLADELEKDIRNRQLKPGDIYMTSLEAARFLGVSGTLANKTLQILEKRQVIRRSQRSGAVILDVSSRDNVSPIDTVHFLVQDRYYRSEGDKYYRTEGISDGGIMLGTQEVLPTSQITHSFLTPETEIRQVANLIDRSFGEKTTDAFVLVRVSYDTQQMLARSGLPTIVYGTVYRGVDNISGIDRDNAMAVRLVSEYFQKRDRSRLAVLMRQQMFPGDHAVIDTLHETSFPLTFRFTPTENLNIESEVCALLESKNRPDAFLCQTLRQAECVDRVRRQLKIRVNQMDIVVLLAFLKKGEVLPFPYIASCCDPEALGKRVGELLLKRVAGETIREFIPVELVLTKR